MKTLTLLCSALVMGLSSMLVPSQANEGGYGGFSKENIQEFYDYINGQEMIKVQTGEELNQAIDAIPINLETAIDLEQERGLRDWLRQYLIAFSESGNDSLVAVLYLRAEFNKERYIAQSLAWVNFALENARNPSVTVKSADGTILTSEEEIKKEAKKLTDDIIASAETALEEGPLPFFRSMHKNVLGEHSEKYFIENVSFHDSSFRVLELGEEEPTFLRLASDRGMLPVGYRAYPTALSDKLPALLEAGGKITCADILLIVEEPLAFTSDEAPRRTSSFFRLMWDQDKKLWCHVEVFFSPGVGMGEYFFNLL